jgi:hypothetical protein
MSTLNNRLLSVAIVLFIVTTLASNGAVRTLAQTISDVVVKNTASNPVPVKAVGTTIVSVSNPATAPVWARVTNPATSPVWVRGTNPATFPLWVRDVDTARQPFQAQYNFEISEGSYGVGGLTAVTVPARKRLVLEYFSIRLTIPQGQSPQDGPTIEVTNGGQLVEYWLPPPTYSGTLAGTTYVYVSSEPVTLYGDPGTTIGVGASRSALTGTARVKVSLSGYLVNVP